MQPTGYTKYPYKESAQLFFLKKGAIRILSGNCILFYFLSKQV